jgi:hypothetical protein
VFRGIGVALICLLTIAAIGVGCGSSDSDTASGDEGLTTSSLSPAEYRKEADKICVKAVTERNAAFNSGYEELVGKSGTLTKAQEEKVVKDATFPLMRTTVKELEELGAPSGDEAQIEGILASIEAGTDSIEAEPAGVLTTRDPYEETKKLAYEYELPKCGQI